MVRKILAIFMSMLMLMMSMAVYANETEHVHEGCCCEEIEPAAVVPGDDIVPMAEKCMECGIRNLAYITRYSETISVWRSCSHEGGDPKEEDLYHVVYKYSGYGCPLCTSNESLKKSVYSDVLVYCFGL